MKIALSLPEKFQRYAFLDKKAGHAEQLRALVRREFPELESRCRIEQAEANEWRRRWCREEDWRAHRAVVFLDPYGMSVEWETLLAIARTKGIDLRPGTIFAQVVDKPLILKNSRNSPMYALCFAAGNPRGAKTAVKIASHLTRE